MPLPMLGFQFSSLKGADVSAEIKALNAKLAPCNAALVATTNGEDVVGNLELITVAQLADRQATKIVA